MDLPHNIIKLETFPIELETFPIELETFSIKLETFPIKLETFPIKLETFLIKLETFSIKSETFPIELETFPIGNMFELYRKNTLCRRYSKEERVIGNSFFETVVNSKRLTNESCVRPSNKVNLDQQNR